MTPEEHSARLAELNKPILSRERVTLIAIAILLAWLLPTAIVVLASKGTETASQFGDAFGMVNALFTALAFGGVIYTVLLQRRELGLQRLELELTRDELKRSADAQEKSEAALRKQAESLLLAAQLNAIVARIDVYDLQIADNERRRRSLAL